MTKYRCSKCSYSFTPKTDKVPSVCPYCGVRGVLRLDESAGDILRKV